MNNYNLISKVILISFIGIIFSCNNKPEEEINVSDMLENSLSSVVTIKIKSKGLVKKVFGFADTGISNVAYKKILNIGDAAGTGSGFIINFNGKKYVITNSHVIDKVIENKGNISAFSYSRKEYQLELIGGDSFYDLAVLKFIDENTSEITSLPFSSGVYKIGEEVYAIGNPLGNFPYTVTQGIISAKNRPGYTAKTGYLQTTAMLSEGNSGGPLINKKGELVGINTLISESGHQLNFALESKIIKKVIKDIINYGRVKRIYIGLEIIQDYQYYIDENDYLQMCLIDEIPRINSVIPNSPASKVLQNIKGAKILKANGIEITSNEDLLGIFETLKPKDTLYLELEKNYYIEKYSIITDELTKEKLSDIATFYFANHYEINLTTDEERNVILNYPYRGYKNNTFQLYDSKRKKFRNYIPRGEQAYIIAMGDFYNMYFWRINELSDLGSALRLTGLDGQIFFMDYDGKNSYIIKVLLSNKKDMISKTLLN